MRIGIDIGSTTVKVILLDDKDTILFKSYERHMSKVREKTAEMLRELEPRMKGQMVRAAITGSAGLGVAKAAGLEFVQEVFATAGAVERFVPDTDAVVELGGEDAKIIFFSGGLEERTRAMLKVEDGCVNFCTYCIIPYARGPVRSLPLAEAARQAAELREEGYREIVLTGIEISSWGRDLKDGTSLIDLVEAICAAAPGVRIRLGSLEPRTVTEDFCRRAAALPDLCPQFHLSLQSGCDETLRRMNRKYDTARYAQSVALLNQYFDRPAITTDLICGFPEETEEEFSQTLRFIAACGFAQIHIFPYSVRPGTPAAEMPQISKAVKEERCRRASETAAGMRRAYLEGCVGQVYPVLFEQPRDGKFFGHAPNYMEVLADGEGLHNQVRTVEITGTDGQALLGRILEG